MEFIIHNCNISMANTVYILLGANLGNPKEQIESAYNLLSTKIGKVIAVSSLYKSEAWGIEDQPIFYNQVLCFETILNPTNCLLICQQIELELGRVREKKWGARVIDIDILYYNNEIIKTEKLIIPHPFIHLRNFTLIPLNEVAPDYIHPVLNKTNNQLLSNSEDKLQVQKI